MFAPVSNLVDWIPICACVPSKLLDSVSPPADPAPLGARHPHQVLHRGRLLVRPQGQVLQGDLLDDSSRGLGVGGLVVVEQGGDVHLPCLLHLLDCQASGRKLSCKNVMQILLQRILSFNKIHIIFPRMATQRFKY